MIDQESSRRKGETRNYLTTKLTVKIMKLKELMQERPLYA